MLCALNYEMPLSEALECGVCSASKQGKPRTPGQKLVFRNSGYFRKFICHILVCFNKSRARARRPRDQVYFTLTAYFILIRPSKSATLILLGSIWLRFG